jgi:hypothetical protein
MAENDLFESDYMMPSTCQLRETAKHSRRSGTQIGLTQVENLKSQLQIFLEEI